MKKTQGPKSIAVKIDAYPATSLSDPDANNLPIDQPVSGSITIMAGTTGVVPTPPTWVPVVLAFAIGTWRRRRAN